MTHTMNSWIPITAFVILALPSVIGQEIYPNEEELILTSGATYEISCQHHFKISWKLPFDNNATSPKEMAYYQDDRGMHVAKLKFTKAHFMDTGFYHCIPKDSEDDTHYIYIYVADPDNLFVSDESMMLQATELSNLIIPCRPTSPSVNVTLLKDGEQILGLSYDPREGFKLLSLQVRDSGTIECIAQSPQNQQSLHFELSVHQETSEVPRPIIRQIEPLMSHVVVGHEFLLECQVMVSTGTLVHLSWSKPHEDYKKRLTSENRTNKEEHNNIHYDVHSIRLRVTNANKDDSGAYTCNVQDASENKAQDSFILTVDSAESNYLNLLIDGEVHGITVRMGERHVQWIVNVFSNPPAKVSWYNPNGKKMLTDEKYSVSLDKSKSKVKIKDLDIEDSGIYVLQADNSIEKKSLNVTLLVEDKPSLFLAIEDYYMLGVSYKIRCAILAYPIPVIEWFYNDCTNYPTCSPKENKIDSELLEMPDGIHLESSVTITVSHTIQVKCKASNFLGNTTEVGIVLVTDVENGFNLWGDTNVVTSDDVLLTCAASKYNYSDDISWTYTSQDGNLTTDLVNTTLPGLFIVESMSKYSFWSTINIKNVSLQFSGYYSCQTNHLSNDSISKKKVHLIVKELRAPEFSNFTNLNGGIMDVEPGQKIIFYCFVSGFPPPSIVWFKNGISIEGGEDSPYVFKNDEQTLEIISATKSTVGRYSCIATNKAGTIKAEKSIQLLISKPAGLVALIIGVVVFIIFCGVVIVFLCVRIKKERWKHRDELSFVGLNNFSSGHPEILNPNLDIYDQAENLPYIYEIWEFPRDKLKLSRQLGSGAFGVVVKAEAHGLNNSDQPVTVAVKMVKQNSDLVMIKNLASELKILSHLGKHLNIVNLVGACTQNLKNRELLVIVEYCKYGNLHNYLQKHRSLFINQINPSTGDLEPLTRDQTTELKNLQDVQGNYHKSLGQASVYSNDSSRHLIHSTSTPTGYDGYLLSKDVNADEGYYHGDYKASSVKPICTQDLLCWAYQLANGMDYLATRKVLHGDLAARNVLLAEDNIVKICDFGLSKNMYKNDNYLKQGTDLLPVKWMSVEALKDRIFSTQSDVWSYGVVLWEFFSLAKTPYPDLPFGKEFLSRLNDGYRMEKPEYCPDTVYTLMLDCWNIIPMERPSFDNCSSRIGNLLQDSVREHYMGLNDNYLKLNSSFEGQDYLAMLNNPTFENMTTVCNNDYVSEPMYVNVQNPPKQGEEAERFELEPMLNKGVVSFHNPGYGELLTKVA